MYAKIFQSIYDGSLRRDWKALVVFQQLLVLCDSEGFIDATPEAISARTSIPLDVIQHGLDVLRSPDPESRTKDNDGRRLLPINPDRAWGWRICNYTNYRDIRTASQLRDYWADAKRKERVTKLQETTALLRGKLNLLFSRNENDGWSYLEESELAAVARRQNCLFEIEQIEDYRTRAGKFFPQSMARLLSNWTEVLDKARLKHSETEGFSGADKMLASKELDRIEARIKTIRSQYDGHQCADEKDRAELKRLRERQSQLKTKLGFIA